MSIAAALDLEMHCIDPSQAFIQSSWDDLPEGAQQIFIRPPSGWDEEPGIVYEVLRPLYGIPSSARALHFTLAKFMSEQGFVKSGFEESVWVREADEKYKHQILMSAHIDYTLILCKDIATLQDFKQQFLTRFKGTDEGEVTEYLGCEIERDRVAGTLKISQCTYIRRILETHGMTDTNPVKMPLNPARDCRGGIHLKGTMDEGITFFRPFDPADVNRLHGWVDSDYAADPDNRRSTTSFLRNLLRDLGYP